MSAPPLRYQLLIILFSPVYLASVSWKAWKGRSKRFLIQRLGLDIVNYTESHLWIHCASVGEVTAALPLIDRIRKDYPGTALLVTTTSETGAATIERKNWADVKHAYLPVDTKAAMSKMIAAYNPQALVILETELWPNLINLAALSNIPVVIINGRISAKSLSTPVWFRKIFRQALSNVTAILAKSETDADGFKALGASNDQVSVIGNLKFAALPAMNAGKTSNIDRPFWLAASTHEDEERKLCSALLDIDSDTLMVLVPRHPKRSESIQESISQLPIQLAVRSKGESITADTQVYLADTLGEMDVWLSGAQVVFMGGSLVPVGGHNLLEPAAAGLPIVSGPHLENFQDEAQLLRDAGALLQQNNATEVLAVITQLLSDAQRCKRLGNSGKEAVAGNADVLERYIDALYELVTIK